MTIRMRIGTWRLIFLTIVAFVGFVLMSPAARAQIQPAATSTTEAPPIPETQIPADITAAINSPERPAADKAPDRFMLKFVKAPAVATGASGGVSGQ